MPFIRSNSKFQEEDVNVLKVLKRDGSQYVYEAELTITFCDVSKCQVVINFLVEKLDSSVIISTPEFFHSYQRLDVFRYMSYLNSLIFTLLSVRDCRLLYSCLDV